VNEIGLRDVGDDPEREMNEIQRLVAKLNFDICAASSVYAYCVDAADQYAELVEADGEDWESRAYLGSSYGLKARDFPIQGLWQIFPGPGFVRLYYMNRSKKHLDEAVDAQPLNPITRLIRASTYVSMPGKSEVARNDMKLLLSWISDPDSNADYAELLRLRAYVDEVYLEYVTKQGPEGGMLSDTEAHPYWVAIAVGKRHRSPGETPRQDSPSRPARVLSSPAAKSNDYNTLQNKISGSHAVALGWLKCGLIKYLVAETLGHGDAVVRPGQGFYPLFNRESPLGSA